jgi:hypothetical protein
VTNLQNSQRNNTYTVGEAQNIGGSKQLWRIVNDRVNIN